MIVWLVKELSMRGRVVVTASIGAWMIMMMVLTVWYNTVIIREMKREFSQLQQDHAYMKDYMEKNIRNFATTIERNTQQTKKNAEIVKDLAEPDK
jgi:ABC-type multidrug transport system fused ATPase/permease subunit